VMYLLTVRGRAVAIIECKRNDPKEET